MDRGSRPLVACSSAIKDWYLVQGRTLPYIPLVIREELVLFCSEHLIQAQRSEE